MTPALRVCRPSHYETMNCKKKFQWKNAHEEEKRMTVNVFDFRKIKLCSSGTNSLNRIMPWMAQFNWSTTSGERNTREREAREILSWEVTVNRTVTVSSFVSHCKKKLPREVKFFYIFLFKKRKVVCFCSGVERQKREKRQLSIASVYQCGTGSV